MRKRGAKESGQATVELAVMLLAVTAMLLGVVILSGVMTADNRQLLEAKLSAELRAGNADTPAWRSENELGFWSYGSYSVNGRHYATIPFSSGDRLPSEQKLSSRLRSAPNSVPETFAWPEPSCRRKSLSGPLSEARARDPQTTCA